MLSADHLDKKFFSSTAYSLNNANLSNYSQYLADSINRFSQYCCDCIQRIAKLLHLKGNFLFVGGFALRNSRSSALFHTILNIIYVFNSFPIIWTITKGDPANRTDTLVTYLYKLAFYNGKQGQAAAVSVIGFLILLFCASLYMVSVLKKGDE